MPSTVEPPPAPTPRRATVNMADVAARAGVSIATVSRALRDVPGVSGPTRARIRRVADELSYVVSPEASRLSRRETGRVAVVVPRIDIWFYSTMLAGIERVLRGADLDVLVYQVDGEAQRSRFFRDLPSRRKVDAVVLIALPVPADEEGRLELLGVEVIVAGGRLRDYPHVRVDDHRVALTACRHLIDLGHTRIAMVRTGDTDGTRWSSDVERTRGYRDALAEAQVPLREEYVVTEPFGVSAGAAGIDALLALPEPPTAVFGYSDEIAMAVLQRLHVRGVAVPGQLSVVGVDGHPLAELFGLTTVVQRVDAQARLAGEMVLSRLREDPHSDPSILLEPELVVRSTTAAPAAQ
ncbi:MAG: LacI family DNA-binding transcriptional regulator [Nocardioides sp.]